MASSSASEVQRCYFSAKCIDLLHLLLISTAIPLHSLLPLHLQSQTAHIVWRLCREEPVMPAAMSRGNKLYCLHDIPVCLADLQNCPWSPISHDDQGKKWLKLPSFPFFSYSASQAWPLQLMRNSGLNLGIGSVSRSHMQTTFPLVSWSISHPTCCH